MSVQQERDRELHEHLLREFGERGRRAVHFLQTADALLALPEGRRPPRLGETVAYSLREALKELPQSAGLLEAGQWGELSRGVVEAKNAFVQAIDAADKDALLDRLIGSIGDLERFHEQERIHQRRLLAVIRTRIGVDPLREARDPIVEYQSLLDALDTAAHGSATIAEAIRLRDRAVQLLHRLFPPPDLALKELERLAAVAQPGEGDRDRLLEVATSPHHLNYFFSRGPSTAWLPLLQPTGILNPPAAGVWPVLRLAEQHQDAPDEVLLAWLQDRVEDAKRSVVTARSLAAAAARLGEGGHAVLLQLLRRYPTDDVIAYTAEFAVREVPPTSRFVTDALDLLLNPSGAFAQRGAPDRLLRHLVEGTNRANVRARLRLLRFKINKWIRTDKTWMLESPMRSIRHYAGGDEVPQRLTAAFLAIVDKAIEAGLDVEELLDEADKLHGDVSARVRSVILLAAQDVDTGLIVAELAGSVPVRYPTSDDLDLIHRLARTGQRDALAAACRKAFGQPPAPSAVTAACAAMDIPGGWLHRLWWAAALPEGAASGWEETLATVTDAVGAVTPELIEHESKRPRFQMWAVEPPLRAEELKALEPAEAAGLIARWRPGEDGHHDAYQVAQELTKVVADNGAAWANNAPHLVRLLRHPTYIAAMLRGLRETKADLSHAGLAIADAVATVSQRPWNIEAIGTPGDFEPSWDPVIRDGIELIGPLAGEVDFGPRNADMLQLALDLAEPPAELADRSSTSPFHDAIRLLPTRALDTALRLGAVEVADGRPFPGPVLALLERVLRLSGAVARPYRALLGAHVRLLERLIPDWLNRHGDELFAADDKDLAHAAVDAALDWAAPSPWLHRRYPRQVDDACRRGVENAVDSLLVVMLWAPGSFEPSGVARRLLDVGVEAVGSAALGLVRVLGDQQREQHLETVLDFWDAVLALRIPADGLRGFGWLVELEIDDRPWCERMRDTARAARGTVEVAYRVAERAAQVPTGAALALVTQLVRGNYDAWERAEIGDAGLRLLAATSGAADLAEARQSLRTALLEQGFSAALNGGDHA